MTNEGSSGSADGADREWTAQVFETEEMINAKRSGLDREQLPAPTEAQEVELPWVPLLLTYMVLASDAVALTIIAPLAPDQCREQFGMEDMPGTCAGALVGGFTMGVCLSALILGHVADLIGRKKIMMLGLFTGWICTSMYGLVSNFWLAFAIRVFAGLTNANLVLTRAVCADLTTGAQRVLAFAYLWSVFSVSRGLSGTAGGILSEESNQPFTLNDNRFFFPCFVGGSFNLVTLVLAGIYLPETNKFAKKGDGEEFEAEFEIDGVNKKNEEKKNKKSRKGKKSKGEKGDKEQQVALLDKKGGDDEEGKDVSTDEVAAVEDDLEAIARIAKRKGELGLVDKLVVGLRVLRADNLQILFCVIYCLGSFANGAVFTLVILYLSEPVDRNGIGFTTLGEGLMISWYSLVGFCYQVFLFKRFSTQFSNFNIFRLSMCVFMFGCAIQPLASLPYYVYGETATSRILTIVTTGFVLVPISIGMMNGLSVLGTMQSNISRPDMQGLAMGVQQSFSSFVRAAGPLLAGILFDALSKESLGFLSFWVVGVVYFTCLALIMIMDEEDKWRSQESRWEMLANGEEKNNNSGSELVDKTTVFQDGERESEWNDKGIELEEWTKEDVEDEELEEVLL